MGKRRNREALILAGLGWPRALITGTRSRWMAGWWWETERANPIHGVERMKFPEDMKSQTGGPFQRNFDTYTHSQKHN